MKPTLTELIGEAVRGAINDVGVETFINALCTPRELGIFHCACNIDERDCDYPKCKSGRRFNDA